MEGHEERRCVALRECMRQAWEQDLRCTQMINELKLRVRELETRQTALRAAGENANAALAQHQKSSPSRAEVKQAAASHWDARESAAANFRDSRGGAYAPSSVAAFPPSSLQACHSLPFINTPTREAGPTSQSMPTAIKPQLPPQTIAVSAPVGLPNRSQDCFWLSAMQCLRHTPGFATALSVMVPSRSRQAANLGEGTARLLLAMQAAESQGCVSEDNPALGEFLLNAMQTLPKSDRGAPLIHWEPAGQKQQDTHEFLNQLLDCLSMQLADRDRGACSPHARHESARGDNGARLEALDRELTEACRIRAQSPSKQDRLQATNNAYNLLYEYSIMQWAASATRMHSRAMSTIFEGQRLASMYCKSCHRYAASEAPPCVVEEVKLSPDEKDSSWFPSMTGLFGDAQQIPKLSLAELLRQGAERSAPDDYICPNPACKSVGVTLRTTRLLRLPAVLVIHVNRAQPDGSRCEAILNFEPALDLGAVGLVAPFGQPLDRNLERCGSKYSLFGAVFHRGSTARSGHYFAYVNLGGEWFCVDDSRRSQALVTPMALEASSPERGPRVALLFYKRLDEYTRPFH